jgi:hypothetical protein
MTKTFFAGLCAAAALLAGCSQPIENEAPAPEPVKERPTYSPAASAHEAIQQRIDKSDALGIFEMLTAAVRDAPGGPRGCVRVQRQEYLGDVPADAKPAKLRTYAGAQAIAVHCTADPAKPDPVLGQYLVIFPKDAIAPVVLDCFGKGEDPVTKNICWTAWASR